MYRWRRNKTSSELNLFSKSTELFLTVGWRKVRDLQFNNLMHLSLSIVTVINGTDLQTFTCHGVPTGLVLIVRPAHGPPAGRKKATMFSQLINTISLTIMLKTCMSTLHLTRTIMSQGTLLGH